MNKYAHVLTSRTIAAVIQMFWDQMTGQTPPIIHHRKTLSIQYDMAVYINIDIGEPIGRLAHAQTFGPIANAWKSVRCNKHWANDTRHRPNSSTRDSSDHLIDLS
ncbi:MAG TPA: hypothetical protein VJ783_15465 [Pirellulales bacterium]|nr:hypothetical protein [Pirellulales bacterium]